MSRQAEVVGMQQHIHELVKQVHLDRLNTERLNKELEAGAKRETSLMFQVNQLQDRLKRKAQEQLHPGLVPPPPRPAGRMTGQLNPQRRQALEDCLRAPRPDYRMEFPPPNWTRASSVMQATKVALSTTTVAGSSTTITDVTTVD